MRQTHASHAVLDQNSFQVIADIAYCESGLQLAPEKTTMIQSRLRHRLAALKLSSFSQYAEYLSSKKKNTEASFLVSALTTNVSHFFREPHHFKMMIDIAGQRLIEKAKKNQKIRIWSAGCSNGQEPFSVAIEVAKKIPQVLSADFRILATDIDGVVIKNARAAVYQERQIDGVNDDDRRYYFQELEDGRYRVKNEIRSLARFNELNLLGNWPISGKFDVIFCRNVAIYFDAATQSNLWPRLCDALLNEGLLFVGHSERIMNFESLGLVSVGPTAFQKQR